jgi:hypothetical protein
VPASSREALAQRACRQVANVKREVVMWARVARFEGDPADLDERVGKVRALLDSGSLPPEVADARLLMLVDRDSGGMVGVTLFETEEALRKGDEAMNAGAGNAGSRTSVEFYEVPLHTL